VSKRKKRKGEFVCDCNAYKFPHRFGGGKCHGTSIVSEHWNLYWGHCEECEGCNSFVNGQCEVDMGLEKESECQVFQEFVNYNEIKLLGDYWK